MKLTVFLLLAAAVGLAICGRCVQISARNSDDELAGTIPYLLAVGFAGAGAILVIGVVIYRAFNV